MIYEYRGHGMKEEFFRSVAEVAGGTVSPGGAVQLLRISRQYVDKLMMMPEVRAWVLYEGRISRASIVEISIRDLIRYGYRVGRLKNITDIGLGFPISEEEWTISTRI